MGRIYCSVQLQYSLLGVFCVAIGFCEAKDVWTLARCFKAIFGVSEFCPLYYASHVLIAPSVDGYGIR